MFKLKLTILKLNSKIVVRPELSYIFRQYPLTSLGPTDLGFNGQLVPAHAGSVDGVGESYPFMQ
jgi:hypothetical protein